MPTAERVSLSSWALGSFVALSLLHLALLAAQVGDPITLISKATLMPALAWWAFSGRRPRGRLSFLLGLALLFSWLGDVAPAFVDESFLLMVAFFLVAQLCWIALLLRWWRHSILGRRWWLASIYLVYAFRVLRLTAPGAGALAPAILVYAVALAAMGMLSTGLGWPGILGGVLFLLSDSMIAVFTFAPHLDPGEPLHSLLIMASYCAAQGLLVWGVRRIIVRGASTSSTSS